MSIILGCEITHLSEENRVKSLLVLLNLKQICGRHHVYIIESDGIYRMDRRESKKTYIIVLILKFLHFLTGIFIEIKFLHVTFRSISLNQS